MPKRAIIIGAGPAGLTAAYELLDRTGIHPVVLEKSDRVGGICRTVEYKGNRIDIGGHRFFSKSDRVMDWWLRILPIQSPNGDAVEVGYHGMRRSIQPGNSTGDTVMLVRPRKSRIYCLGKFFDYPITFGLGTLTRLGPWRALRIGVSYLRSALFPLKPERNLEEFFINRFGVELYRTFFRSYTQKVWGVPCNKISAEWGAQRIKGVSIGATLKHALTTALGIGRKNTETSLLEQFLYPKFGPGQMWEEVARRVCEKSGEIRTGYRVDRILSEGGRVYAVEATHCATGARERFEGDYFFSTAPIRELLRSLEPAPPNNVLAVSDGLLYRDFVMVGLLVRSLKLGAVQDNWIYIQDPSVQLGRLQIYNNWSPAMVRDPETTWLGLEYFCDKSDRLWDLSDEEMIAFAKEELSRIDIIDAADVMDGTVVRMEKTYPSYFGSYAEFPVIRSYIDGFENLFLVGRNGMHRYNNQDHSMLTAMMAVDNIVAGTTDRAGLWEVNTETEHHETQEERKPRN